MTTQRQLVLDAPAPPLPASNDLYHVVHPHTFHADFTSALRRQAAHAQAALAGRIQTFDFLGFTFIRGRNSRGNFLLCRKTRRDRMRARLLDIKEELRRCMHQAVHEQGAWLKQVVAGYFAYHGVPTNSRTLRTFRNGVEFLWMRSLRKRIQLDRTTWDKMRKLMDEWLPKPRVLHPCPSQRFAVKHPRWEPYAGVPPVRFCAGSRTDARPYRDQLT